MHRVKISSLKSLTALQDYLATLGMDLPIDRAMEVGPQAALAQPLSWPEAMIGNRFCILPMEGWDGDQYGRPTESTLRRWSRFGYSGAKLIWGGEAVAVRPDGRANPHQLLICDANLRYLEQLRRTLLRCHDERFGNTADLLIGLQLTHSGRFARPHESSRPEPRIAYRHPWLDPRVGIRDDHPLLTDDDLLQLVDDFIAAGVLAHQAGFSFVDIKHCHGYLGHELLSAYHRPGAFGGDLRHRTRFLRDIVAGLRAAAPKLQVGVRISVFDMMPFQKGAQGVGIPSATAPYPYAFGGDGSGVGVDLQETSEFLDLLSPLGIRLVCTTAGSPYYNPHIQRPAYYPPSDGYDPPEDPLVGVARQIHATAQLKLQFPQLIFVGSGYSYLQEWLPHVAQAVVRRGLADVVGIGRLALSYPDFPADVLAGMSISRRSICRTFSDCTTAPRNGLVSGCYPLDEYYRNLPEYVQLQQAKSAARSEHNIAPD